MKLSVSYCITLIAIAAIAVGCAHNRSYNLPPAQQLMEPGPGVGGPGPGVLTPAPVYPNGACGVGPMTAPTVQLLFNKPEGMVIAWDVGGVGMFDSQPLVVPGRATFGQGGIFRLKVSNIKGREGVELYPTLEVGPVTPRTDAYLAHNAIPIQLTEEDFDQVQAGNFVTKVIYLPDPEFQELALAGVETLVSTRLDPGIDPIVEADRRGAILAIIRVGNKDLEVPGAQVQGDPSMGGVLPVAAIGPMPGMAYGPGMGMGMGMPGAPGTVLPYGNVPSNLSGVTSPQWGMPISGTPIGLPGPPHIPLGVPAGLTKHVINNRTPMNIPEPVSNFKINVRQQPGYSYPKPPTRMRIHEQSIYPPLRYGQPHESAQQQIY